MRRTGFRSTKRTKPDSGDYVHRVAKLQRQSDFFFAVAFRSGSHDGGRCSAVGGAGRRRTSTRRTSPGGTGPRSTGAGACCTSRTGGARRPCSRCPATRSAEHGPRDNPGSLLP